MPVVGFFSKNATIKLQNEWEKRLKIHLPSIKLVPLLSADAEEATSALIWKSPLERLEDLNNLKGLISLGQGVDHILKKDLIPKKIPIVRIVDPYMAKSMSHWVILSVLNYIRNYDGYRYQQKQLIYKPIKIKDFKKVKIGVYGLGEIGNVVASDLSNLGFKVLGWSRTKKQNEIYNTFFDLTGLDSFFFIAGVAFALLFSLKLFINFSASFIVNSFFTKFIFDLKNLMIFSS